MKHQWNKDGTVTVVYPNSTCPRCRRDVYATGQREDDYFLLSDMVYRCEHCDAMFRVDMHEEGEPRMLHPMEVQAWETEAASNGRFSHLDHWIYE